MVFIKEIKLVQSYVICEVETVVDDVVYCEYGITQTNVVDDKHSDEITIDCISTDRGVVETLVKRMMVEIVDPITLQYIVDDYLGEIFGL